MNLPCPNCEAALKRVKRTKDPVTGDPVYDYVCSRCKTKWRGGRDDYLEERR